MKLLALLLCCTAHGNARLPNNPFPRMPAVRKVVSNTQRTIDGGRRIEHRLRFDDGTSKRFIFEMPTIRFVP